MNWLTANCRYLVAAPLLLIAATGLARAAETAEKPTSFRDLAASADLIAVVQDRDTDYVYQREFPVKGSAFLKVLIPYKTDKPLDMIEVYDEGLHKHECYFPDPPEVEQGPRYLVFLRHDPENKERYRGLAQGCALEVLVDSDNRYMLRYPPEGIALSDDLADLAQTTSFSDPHAYLTEEQLDPKVRNELLAKGDLRKTGDGYVYTRGIAIERIRELMGPEGLTLDRHIRRVTPDSELSD